MDCNSHTYTSGVAQAMLAVSAMAKYPMQSDDEIFSPNMLQPGQAYTDAPYAYMALNQYSDGIPCCFPHIHLNK
jgi:hypothetical protein